MPFLCNVCGADIIARRVTREDGVAVAFCGQCGMGMVEHPPTSTEAFYADGYYGADSGDQGGYHDYTFTAEHTQLWVRLMVEALLPQGGRILDVGCATGAMLASLPDGFERFGIEVNATAAEQARAQGVTVIGTDINDAALTDVDCGHFDVITSIATFEHVLDLRGAVLRCLGLLAPGGTLVFEVPLISETADNKDWFGGSYEHIHYPTVVGMRHLFDHLPGVHWAGFESDIKGFSASYLGIASRNERSFALAERLLLAMGQDTPEGLGLNERRLNLAYHVVHNFRPTPERVLALPDLLDVVATPHLLRRLTQLWHGDAVQAANAAYHEQQAANFQAAWRQAVIETNVSQPEAEAIALSGNSVEKAEPQGPGSKFGKLSKTDSPQGILAIFPFLVKQSLPISVMREMLARGNDVTIARYLPLANGYTMDALDDFAAEGRLIDLQAHLGESGTNALESIVDERGIGMVLQIGAPWAYPQLTRLKERRPELRMLDTLYNNGPHFHSFVMRSGCFDGVLVESREMVRLLEVASPGVHVIQVESGVDTSRFIPAGRSAAPPQPDLVLGYVGRMSPEKNPLGFVSLVEHLHEELPWLRCVMFGEGAMAAQVQARIAASPASAAIRFAGYASHPTDALAEIDVLVVPSVMDGRPASVMEASACAIPVLGAPVGSIPELIEEGRNGYVIAPNDFASVASLLAGWRQDLESFARLRGTARQVAEARFNRNRMMDAYEAAYRETLARPARPVAIYR
jgi:glycosyltransferase involved in cell wall biosynthesis/SAM-dependent methyltransferase